MKLSTLHYSIEQQPAIVCDDQLVCGVNYLGRQFSGGDTWGNFLGNIHMGNVQGGIDQGGCLDPHAGPAHT